MTSMDSAYDYYISRYANSKVSRYDSHNKSDLRKVYCNIIKSNKDAPLYKILNVEHAKRYAIDIKENARSIQNVVASLSDKHGSFGSSFQKKVAMSSDSNRVGVTYIGNGTEESPSEQFDIFVDQLAAPQVNEGQYLPDHERSFPQGSYSFDLATGSAAYEFQYSVNEGETNLDIINKLAKLVNTSNLGITAEVRKGDEGTSALALISGQTGLNGDENYLFSIAPAASSESVKAMEILGINRVTEQAHNSSFTVNGQPHTSLSNTFTINNMFELTLKGASQHQLTSIGFKPNADAIADNIQTLVDAYNQFLGTAEQHAEADGNKLLNDMASVSRRNQVALENIGLMVGKSGAITLDRTALADAVAPKRADSTFAMLNRFRDSVGNKAENASINPMNYVNKVIVAYKKPGHHFATPYISSIYSGMMLDHYI